MSIRPKNIVVKRIKYRGFLIELIDSAYWDLRYEYKITPQTEATKKLLKAQKIKPIIYDSSGTRSVRLTTSYAKGTVDDCWRNFVTGLLYA